LARRLEFTLHGNVLPPPTHDPLTDRKETLKYLWVLMRGEGERGGKKSEHWGKPGWLVEGYTSNWLKFIWPEVTGQDMSNLAAWCSQTAARHEGFARLRDARERRDGEKNVPGLFFVADDLDMDAVPQYVARQSRPRRTAKEDAAEAMAQLAEVNDALAKMTRERDEWVQECDQLMRQLKHAPEKAEIEQASIDGINTDLRDQTIAQRRELEAVREENESLRRSLASSNRELAESRMREAAVQHNDCVPDDVFRRVRRENFALNHKLNLLGKHLDLAAEVLKG
jgi:hypothetical protein